MPWWTEVRGINESPNESSRAAVSIADDGEPVMGFSQRAMSVARVDVAAIVSPSRPDLARHSSGVIDLIVPCGGQSNITQKGSCTTGAAAVFRGGRLGLGLQQQPGDLGHPFRGVEASAFRPGRKRRSLPSLSQVDARLST
jgi:hypothetical protein